MTTPVVSQVVMDATTVTTIMNNISTIYSNSLGQLITFTIGLLAFVGVLLPVAISLLQSRQLKADQKELNEKISSELQVAKSSLTNDLKTEMAAEIAKLEERISGLNDELNLAIAKKLAGLNARTHHLQAVSRISNELYPEAFLDQMHSIKGYAAAEDEVNLQATIQECLHLVFPNLKKVDLEKNEKLDSSFKDAIKSLEKINKNNRYLLDIDALKSAMKDAVARP